MEREVTVRRARPGDTPAMLQITRNVWEGHDYVPRAWTSWLADDAGVLLAAEVDGAMVGFQHVALHPDGTGWLEGIRVREDMHGRGIATKLLAAGIEWACFSGLAAVRLSTSTDNPASNRLAEQAGLRPVARFASVRVVETAEPPRPCVRLARPDERAAIRRALDDWGASYYTEGWTAYALTDDRLRLLLATAQVVVGTGDYIDAVGIATATAERPHPRLGLIRGTSEGMRAVLGYLRASLHTRRVEATRGQLELTDDAWRILQPCGLERAWEHDMRLWQRDLR
jgi:RimJ/RimL family protein N-acetyltransferase